MSITGHYQQQHHVDVCVVGGGMAGMCAAIAAARRGARTLLVHDRPVLGGNASSEVRMWICGARGKHDKETGLLEEIQLENCYRNPSLNYSIWDNVLYQAVMFQPNLTTLLNCSCTNATMDGSRIESIQGWQLTSYTLHTIHAKQFIDCSGDSILAPLTGAARRRGREASSEFNEDIQPPVADDKTMGNSLLLQIRRTDEPQPFVAPRWAYKFNSPSDLPHRSGGFSSTNFWWIEIGGLDDTIGDAEPIRDELMKIAWGVWDYIKNRSPQRDQAECWALEWLGSLPGKRESLRYEGDHILTQNDIRAGGNFSDIIAYGGWSMDDHHPAGILYPGKPTVFHPAPSPYGIPYRSLYSRNIDNLLFAGRNISVTHAALSSTRVMGTCAILGQAAGTAAALCIQHGCSPRSVGDNHVQQLQQMLMADDCFLPGLTHQASPLAQRAKLVGQGDLPLLLNGMERDRENQSNAWEGPLGGDGITFQWDQPTTIEGLRLVFDSNLSHTKRMPCSYPQKGNRSMMPSTLVREYRVDAQDAQGNWQTVHRETDNYQRLVRLPLKVQAKALRFVPEATWGSEQARLFTVEPIEQLSVREPIVIDGEAFAQRVARTPAEDLAPPANPGESETATTSRAGA